MFDKIILLTGSVEGAALTSILRRHKPQLDIFVIGSLAQLDSLGVGVLNRARLIGFVTPVIVPPRILERLRFGAYNFHPGPPRYPGRYPSHFAIYDRAKYFGATAHLMTERVDAGPIVAIEMFAIPPDISVERLDELVFVELGKVFCNLAKALATQSEPLSELPIKWSGRKTTRPQYESMRIIPDAISNEEFGTLDQPLGARVISA